MSRRPRATTVTPPDRFAGPYPDGTDPRRWRILAVLCVAMFMSLMGVSIVNVALPSIEYGLGATESAIQWVLAGYILTFGVLLVPAGRAGDLFGRGLLFIIGVVIFTGCSVWSGFAADTFNLNVSRAFQGVGSAILNAQVVGMIQQYFRGPERGSAFGIFGGIIGASLAVGPLLGGLLIGAAGFAEGWRWTFFVNLPVGIVAVALALLWFPRPLWNRPGEQPHQLPAPPVVPAPATAASPLPTPAVSRSLDPLGAALLGAAVLAVLFPFVEREGSNWLWLLLPAGGVVLAVWIRWENYQKARGKAPMVDLALFRILSFTYGNLLAATFFIGLPTAFVLVALYFQDGLGHSAMASGLLVAPSAAASGICAYWAGKKLHSHGRMVVILGLYVVVVGLIGSIAVVWAAQYGWVSEWWLLVTLLLFGAGEGAVISPNQALTLDEVPLNYAGSAGGVLQTGQRIGTAIGFAVIMALAYSVLAHTDWSGAFIVGFGAVLVVTLISLLVAYLDAAAGRKELQP